MTVLAAGETPLDSPCSGFVGNTVRFMRAVGM
jgi:hypothetical protein